MDPDPCSYTDPGPATQTGTALFGFRTLMSWPRKVNYVTSSADLDPESSAFSDPWIRDPE